VSVRRAALLFFLIGSVHLAAAAQPKNSPQPILLEPGESHVAHIRASRPINDTRVQVAPGQQYQLTVVGSHGWRDGWIFPVTPDGRSSGFYRSYLSFFSRWKRAPDLPWFALAGSIGANGEPFLIGIQTTIDPAHRGPICCFANDVPRFYWNNAGMLTLHILRTR
jgi:hypothetical protein